MAAQAEKEVERMAGKAALRQERAGKAGAMESQWRRKG